MTSRAGLAAFLAVGLVAGLALAGCGSKAHARPKDDPGAFAVRVLGLLTRNEYTRAWDDLHPEDQRVAPLAEYVSCETRSPVIARPLSVKVVKVNEESIGLGNGRFVDSTAIGIRMRFAGSFTLVHTVHLVASKGKWKWILPSWRFRDYRADRCPSDPGSAPPSSPS
jgi:hypothetical protein